MRKLLTLSILLAVLLRAIAPAAAQVGQIFVPAKMPAPAAAPGPPVLTFLVGNLQSSGGTSQDPVSDTFTLPSGGPHIVIIATTIGGQVLSQGTPQISPAVGSGTCSPAVGVADFANLVATALWYCVMSSASPGSTTFTLHYGQNPFLGTRFAVYTAPIAGFVSTAPVASPGAASAATNTTASTSASATIDGFCISAAVTQQITAGTAGTFGGTFAYTTDAYIQGNSATHAVGSAPATSTVSAAANVAFNNAAANLAIAAACWR
jgi:hypothetical protein